MLAMAMAMAIQILPLLSPLSLLLLVVSAQPQDLAHRGMSRTPWPCRNTVQGRSLLADENGYICGVQEVDGPSGCCPRIQEPFQCIGCNLTSRCCNSFEYCVTCCLNPNRTSNELAIKVKTAQHASAGTYKDTFAFCLGRCRHDSRSVVHENAYATEDHHCFTLHVNSSIQEPRKSDENELDNLSIVLARLGQSCEMACRLNQQTCQSNKLHAINKCSVLQKYFNCRGACIIGNDQPGELSLSAPTDMHPGACLLTTHESALSCEGSNIHARRLCPCA